MHSPARVTFQMIYPGDHDKVFETGAITQRGSLGLWGGGTLVRWGDVFLFGRLAPGYDIDIRANSTLLRLQEKLRARRTPRTITFGSKDKHIS